MNRKWRRVAALCLFTAVACAGSSASAQQLEFRVNLADTSYITCETIWLSAELTNASDDTVRIWGFKFPGGGILKVILTNELGDTLLPAYDMFYGDWTGFTLGPRETYCEVFDLARVFWNHKLSPGPSFPLWAGSLAPGRYEVAAEYLHRSAGHTIRTAAIPFRVDEPTGDEGQAFELFLEGYRSWSSGDYRKGNDALAKLVADYPTSVYAERVYHKFGRDKELLDKMPDSGYLDGYIHRTLKGINDQQEKSRFLEDIIQKHPGTRAAEFAEQRLRRLEREEL